MKVYADVFARIEEVREDAGMTRKDFASELGLSEESYLEAVNGYGGGPSFTVIEAIVTKFSVHPHWLLNAQGPKHLDGGSSHEASGRRIPPEPPESGREAISSTDVSWTSDDLDNAITNVQKLKKQIEILERELLSMKDRALHRN